MELVLGPAGADVVGLTGPFPNVQDGHGHGDPGGLLLLAPGQQRDGFPAYPGIAQEGLGPQTFGQHPIFEITSMAAGTAGISLEKPGDQQRKAAHQDQPVEVCLVVEQEGGCDQGAHHRQQDQHPSVYLRILQAQSVRPLIDLFHPVQQQVSLPIVRKQGIRGGIGFAGEGVEFLRPVHKRLPGLIVPQARYRARGFRHGLVSGGEQVDHRRGGEQRRAEYRTKASVQGKGHGLRRAAARGGGLVPVPQSQQHMTVSGYVDADLSVEKVPVRHCRRCLRGRNGKDLLCLGAQGPKIIQGLARKVRFVVFQEERQRGPQGDAQLQGRSGAKLIRPLRKAAEQHQGRVGESFPQFLQFRLHRLAEDRLVLWPDGPMTRDPYHQGNAFSLHRRPCPPGRPGPECSGWHPYRSP